MNFPRLFGITFVALTLTHGTHVSAQSCNEVPVQNSDFEAFDSLLFPWSVSGMATFEDGQSVDGRTTSRCLRAVNGISAHQPVPFSLIGGQTYEIGFHIQSRDSSGSEFHRVRLLDSTGAVAHTSSSQRTVGLDTRRRVTTLFTPAADADFTIQLLIGDDADIDHVYVRQQPILAAFREQRVAGVANTLDLAGPANANFAAFLSFGARLPQPFSIGPTCSGGWWLTDPTFLLASGVLSNQGLFELGLTIPVELAGFPLQWQPMLLPSTCAFGCPSLLDFF